MPRPARIPAGLLPEYDICVDSIGAAALAASRRPHSIVMCSNEMLIQLPSLRHDWTFNEVKVRRDENIDRYGYSWPAAFLHEMMHFLGSFARPSYGEGLLCLGEQIRD